MKTISGYILKIIGVFTTLLLSILIIGGLLFNSSNISKIINKSGYTEELYASIRTEMENFAFSANLPSEVIDGIISEDALRNDLEVFIKGFYEENGSIDDTISSVLKSDIEDYLKKNNIKSVDNEIIDEFVSAVKDIYVDNVTFNGYLDMFKPYVSKLSRIYPYILISVGIIELIIVLIIAIFYKGLSQVMFAGSFLLFFISCMLLIRIDVSSIKLFSSAFNSILEYIFSKFIVYLFLLGIIEFMIGLILEIIKFWKKKKQIC